MEPIITKTEDLFNEFADADNDSGWYLYEKSFKKAIKKRSNEIVEFFKWHTGIPVSTEMLEELKVKLK
ncbi:MAG: hypothetical protein JETCAE03_32690 [Ignavibacteriaceae bacterium]|nr:MAG: hypothetical protein JETCAE03_32690 [Ignavibacteriaceae bacterium]